MWLLLIILLTLVALMWATGMLEGALAMLGLGKKTLGDDCLDLQENYQVGLDV